MSLGYGSTEGGVMGVAVSCITSCVRPVVFVVGVATDMFPIFFLNSIL